MAREAFKPTPADRSKIQMLETGNYPERVTVDLDDKDPNNFQAVDPANDDADVQVVEVDDRARDERGKPQTDPSTWAQRPEKGFQKRIDRMKAETEAQKRLREQAERERDAAIEAARVRDAEVADLRRRLDANTSLTAKSMIGEREARLTDAERRLANAHAEGNAVEIAKATRDISSASAEITAIRANAPPERTQPEVQQVQQPAPQVQPVRQPPTLSPDAAAWIAHNDTWFNKDVTRTQFAVSLHNTLAQRGINPGDPRYTQELDKGMKAVYPEHRSYRPATAEDMDDEDRSTPRRTNAVEQGSREDTAARPNPNPRTVELTSSQLAIAKSLNLSPQQYAASLVKYNASRKGA